MKKKILILSSSQFGYLTDTLKYCEYSAEQFDITYIGWDYKKNKIDVPNIKVVYVSRESNKIYRNIKLLYEFHKEINQGYDIIFANYVRGISLVKMFNHKKKFILDIRTLCVNPSHVRRFFYDLLLKIEAIFFQNISVISEEVAKKLNIKDFHILPLGGECFSNQFKCFDKFSLLYVGTLQNRNIIDCVKGLHLFLKELQSDEVRVIFTIVGDSPDNELIEIKRYIDANGLENNVITKGHIPQKDLGPYFQAANIGVSYIPIKSHFQFQPPTKTFEYLVSGLPVIATATYSNKKILVEGAGTLIQDNAVSFCAGIKNIYAQKGNFNSKAISSMYASYSWQNIVKNRFIPLIEGLISLP